MDGGITLSQAGTKGRNMWLVWTGGNDRLWDQLTRATFGALDLLKVISSHPSLGYSRANRWDYLGMVNEPCFEQPTGPVPVRYGLWLDVPAKNCAPDPFEDETRYPGVAVGSRGKPIGNGKVHPVGSFYGYATGIMGLRLFQIRVLDANAARKWDPVRYYTDPSYYNRADLVRPYRVGMSCGFCHVGPSPIKPPADPNAPQFANLSSTVGAQFRGAVRHADIHPTCSAHGRARWSISRVNRCRGPMRHPAPRLGSAARFGRGSDCRQGLQGPALAGRQGVHRARLLRDVHPRGTHPRRNPLDRARFLSGVVYWDKQRTVDFCLQF